jgi:hypothetical protein
MWRITRSRININVLTAEVAIVRVATLPASSHEDGQDLDRRYQPNQELEGALRVAPPLRKLSVSNRK